MLGSGEDNHSPNYSCSGFQWTPILVDPGEVSILLQDLYLSLFSSCISKTVKSSFALSFLPMTQHVVGYLRLGFSPILPLQLFDTELCMFLCPKRRSTIPDARHSPELKEERHLLSCLCAGINRRQDRNRDVPLPKGTSRE